MHTDSLSWRFKFIKICSVYEEAIKQEWRKSLCKLQKAGHEFFHKSFDKEVHHQLLFLLFGLVRKVAQLSTKSKAELDGASFQFQHLGGWERNDRKFKDTLGHLWDHVSKQKITLSKLRIHPSHGQEVSHVHCSENPMKGLTPIRNVKMFTKVSENHT